MFRRFAVVFTLVASVTWVLYQRPAVTPADLEAALDDYDRRFEPAPRVLTEAETRAVVAERRAAAEALAAQIGEGGPAAAEAALQRWRTSQSRDRLVLIDGLSRNPSPEAVDALEAIYAEAELFRMREEVLRALGRSTAEGRNELLRTVMREGALKESQIAAGALYGEPEAAPDLVEAVYGTLPMNTRLEAIHSLGAVGDATALDALRSMATSDDLEPRVRQYAEHELGRHDG